MLAQMLRGSDWSKLGDYMSPAFFETVSPLAMASKLGSLSRNYVSKRGFVDACNATQGVLTAAGLPVQIAGIDVTSPAASGPLSPAEIGNLLLAVYFRQILQADTALLDFRSDSFATETTADGTRLMWRPSPLLVQWDGAFIANIRQMYVGFYSQDWAAFDAALAALQLTAGKPLLMEHFGASQQTVKFRLQDFRSTFHDMFVSIKGAKARLPADFIAFGAGLVCLYEHLEKLDIALDVQAAFIAATRDESKA